MESSQPKPLLILDPNKKPWKLDIPVIHPVLDQVGDCQVAIYSINGASRTGKSFLQNYFWNYLKNQQEQEAAADPLLNPQFVWRHGAERETKGIYLWSKPYFVRARKSGHGIAAPEEEDFEDVAILLLDTQGLSDFQTSNSENALIFTVSSLLSSLMIYNHMESSLGEDTLEKIQHYSTLARFFPMTVPLSPSTSSHPLSFNVNELPALLLLFRDFDPDENRSNLNYTYDYGLHSQFHPKEDRDQRSGNYLWDKFYAVIRSSEVVEARRRSRAVILENFPSVAAYLLPNPGQHINDELPAPNADFTEEVTRLLKDGIMNPRNILKKVVAGRTVTGNELKDYVTLVAKSLDDYGNLFKEPTDADRRDMRFEAYQAALLRCTYEAERAYSFYNSRLGLLLSQYPKGCPQTVLSSVNKEVLKGALNIFDSFNGNTVKIIEKEFRGKLQANTKQQYLVMKERNKTMMKPTNWNWFAVSACCCAVLWMLWQKIK